MDFSDGYLAVDWGTSNRRAYRLTGGGEVADSFADDCGVLTTTSDYFAEAAEDIRRRLGQLPMLLAGMVGSNRGWREAPYVDCPADAAALARSVLWIEPGWTGIVPGACQRGERPDVMRGEEVQAIGAAAAGRIPDQALLCHPGTHSKWVVMRRGEIHLFRTAMTGEFFALLQKGSILSDHLQGAVGDGPEFRAAVRAGLDGAEPMAELFGIRARALLGEGDSDAASFASGLLIGADIRAALAWCPDWPVTLIGRGDLSALYAAALEEARRPSQLVDGSQAFVAGIAAIVEKF